MLGIDIGSNTLRMVLMDEKFEKIKSEEYIIGVAKNMKDGYIDKDAIQRLFFALNDLKNKGYNLKDAKAVATAAFRKAKNTQEIFKQIKDDFLLDINLIDANTEARLSILGMQERLKKLNLYRKNLGFCDLGGASCEISNDFASQSYDFGIISFYEKMHFKHCVKFKKIFKKIPKRSKIFKDKKLKIHFSNLHPHFKQLALSAFDEVLKAKRQIRRNAYVLNSGVPTTLCAYKLNIKYKDYKEEKINGKVLNSKDFLNFSKKIWNLNNKEAKIYLGENRKKYLIGGALLLFALFDKQRLIVIDDGVREGVCIAHFKNLI